MKVDSCHGLMLYLLHCPGQKESFYWLKELEFSQQVIDDCLSNGFIGKEPEYHTSTEFGPSSRSRTWCVLTPYGRMEILADLHNLKVE
jgi:hypothetical protein